MGKATWILERCFLIVVFSILISLNVFALAGQMLLGDPSPNVALIVTLVSLTMLLSSFIFWIIWRKAKVE